MTTSSDLSVRQQRIVDALRPLLGLEAEARCIENAVADAIDHGALTADLAPAGAGARPPLSTDAMAAAVIARLAVDRVAFELRD